MAADEIMRDHVRRPIVLINGPSSRQDHHERPHRARIVEFAGVHAEMLSMDDYYRTATEYDQPMDDENGVPDLESPSAWTSNACRATGAPRGRERFPCPASTSKRAPPFRTTARFSSGRTRSS